MPQDRAVFYRTGHNMFAARLELHCGIDRGVVRLGPATRENNFARFAPEQCGRALARQIDRLPYLHAESITARWIAVAIRQEWQHLLHHRRIELRRGVVVEVDNLIASDHRPSRLHQF